MHDLDRDGLTVSLHLNQEPASIVWRGVSDSADPGSFLYPYLDELATTLAGRECIIDFRDLEYMNSSSVGPIFKFVRDLDNCDAKTEIRYSEAVHWQRTSLRALKIIAIRLNHLTVTPL